MMAPFRAATFDMIRPATSTTVRAESSLGQVAPCMRARRFYIAQANSTAMHALCVPITLSECDDVMESPKLAE
jgi:hypothetical protein